MIHNPIEANFLVKEEIYPYSVVTHFQNHASHVPRNDNEEDMVSKLSKMGFEPYQIRILFEKLKVGRILLELENTNISRQLRDKKSSFEKLMNIFKETYGVDFTNDKIIHKAKRVFDLQQYISYLESKGLQWTYIMVYNGNTKLKIGSLYHDEPIPKRMIE